MDELSYLTNNPDDLSAKKADLLQESGIAPIPRNKFVGKIADTTASARDWMNQYAFKDWVPVIGGGGIGDFFIGQAPEEIGFWAEGDSPFTTTPGTGSRIPSIKPSRKQSLADTAFLGADVGPIAAGVAKLGMKGAKKVAPHLAEKAVQMAERGIPGVPGTGVPLKANVIKPKGGNWTYETNTNLNDYFVDTHPAPYSDDLNDLWQLKVGIETAKHYNDMVNVAVRKDIDDILNTHVASPEDRALIEDVIMHGRRPDDSTDRAFMSVPNTDELHYLYSALKGHNKHTKNKYLNKLIDEANKELPQAAHIASPSSIDAPRLIANEWIAKTVPKYVRSQMATPEDPLRRLAEEGKFPIDVERNRLDPDTLANKREKMRSSFPKNARPENMQMGVSEEARRYEDLADSYLRRKSLTEIRKAPHSPWDGSSFRHHSDDNALTALREAAQKDELPQGKSLSQLSFEAKYPWIKPETPGKTHFWSLPTKSYGAAFDLRNLLKKPILDEALLLAEEGKLRPETFSKYSIENVARSAEERRLKELARQAKSGEDYARWAKERYDTLPTQRVFEDNSKAVRFAAETTDDPDLLRRDLSLQTCILNHCVGSAGYDSGRYIPMVEPHTGNPPAAASPGHGTAYYQKVLDGEIEIHSIVDHNGTPKVTIEVRPDMFEDGSPSWVIEQLRGAENGAVPAEQLDNVVAYLNGYRHLFTLPENRYYDQELSRSGIVAAGESIENIQNALARYLTKEVDDEDLYYWSEGIWSALHDSDTPFITEKNLINWLRDGVDVDNPDDLAHFLMPPD